MFLRSPGHPSISLVDSGHTQNGLRLELDVLSTPSLISSPSFLLFIVVPPVQSLLQYYKNWPSHFTRRLHSLRRQFPT